jgi:hypothetical protein
MAVDAQTTVPWWAALLSAFFTGVLVWIATIIKVPVAGPTTTPSVAAFFTETALFIPHALILFGIVADMFAYHGGYAIASLIGFGSIFLNKGLDLFYKGLAAIVDRIGKVGSAAAGTATPAVIRQAGGAITNYAGCNVQGFEYFKSQYTSQTLVVTATILAYYIFDLAMNKGVVAAGASIGVGIALFALQAASMSGGGCFNETGGIGMTSFLSIINGIAIGGFFYGIMEAYGSQLLPSKAISSIPKVNVSDLKVDSATGKLTDSSGKAWSLLPDGTPVPDTCGDFSVTDVDSTGRPASGGTCPGNAVTAQ